MRVEVRRRADASPTGESPAAGQFEIPKHGLSEAYSDDCFESPTRFFIASPEHPKLGKWAQPSTLKYQAPHAHQPSTQCLDEAVLFASTHNKVRPVSSSSLKGRRQNARGSSATSNRLGCGSARIRQKMEPSRAKRSVSPVSPLRAGSESPPSSSIRGRREEPRIDTPVSGRVAPLHQRSLQTFHFPASPVLCGSFDQRPPRAASAGIDRATPTSLGYFTDEGRGHPASTFSSKAANVFMPHVVTLRSDATPSVTGDAEMQADPDVRYRIRLEDATLRGRNEENVRHRGHEHHTLHPSVGQEALLPASSVPSTAALGQGSTLGHERNQPLASTGEEGADVRGPAGGVDLWVASEVDPFLSSLRHALLRDRPADLPTYVSLFSTDWLGARNAR